MTYRETRGRFISAEDAVARADRAGQRADELAERLALAFDRLANARTTRTAAKWETEIARLASAGRRAERDVEHYRTMEREARQAMMEDFVEEPDYGYEIEIGIDYAE